MTVSSFVKHKEQIPGPNLPLFCKLSQVSTLFLNTSQEKQPILRGSVTEHKVLNIRLPIAGEEDFTMQSYTLSAEMVPLFCYNPISKNRIVMKDVYHLDPDF